MAYFDNGIQDYIIAECTVRVAFPIDKKGQPDISCKHCNYFVRATQRCGLTQTIVNYPDHFVGVDCPMKPITQKEYEDYVQRD